MNRNALMRLKKWAQVNSQIGGTVPYHGLIKEIDNELAIETPATKTEKLLATLIQTLTVIGKIQAAQALIALSDSVTLPPPGAADTDTVMLYEHNLSLLDNMANEILDGTDE